MGPNQQEKGVQKIIYEHQVRSIRHEANALRRIGAMCIAGGLVLAVVIPVAVIEAVSGGTINVLFPAVPGAAKVVIAMVGLIALRKLSDEARSVYDQADLISRRADAVEEYVDNHDAGTEAEDDGRPDALPPVLTASTPDDLGAAETPLHIETMPSTENS